MAYEILTHGGAGSKSAWCDGTERAAQQGIETLKTAGCVLDAACSAVAELEDDPRFNAGTGSNLRMDGKTIEMDAACMDSSGEFAAVAALQQVKNPIFVARKVFAEPQILLAGSGANHFARQHGFAEYDPTTHKAVERFHRAIEKQRQGSHNLGPGDTVGAVVSNGKQFAAALSTGGTPLSVLGRVGDVPLPGCGLFVWEGGAVAVTGDGESLARQRLAYHVYTELTRGSSPQQVVEQAVALFPPAVDVGLILLTRDFHGAASNRDMAWSYLRS